MAMAVGALVWAMQNDRSALGPLGCALAAWIIAGVIVELAQRSGKSARLRRLAGLPRADWGKAVAHAGFGVTIFGVSAILAWQQEDIRVLREGESFDMGAYTITMEDVAEVQGPNYLATRAAMRPWSRMHVCRRLPLM